MQAAARQRATELAHWEPRLEEWRMLVPVIRAQTATPLLQIADLLSASTRSSGDVLGIVEVPRTNLPNLPHVLEERRRDLLRWIASIDTSGRASRLNVQTRVSHDVRQGIREAVYENGSNLVVVEWPGLTSRRPRLLAAVLEDLVSDPPANLALVRPDPDGSSGGQGVLVPVRGGTNAPLAVKLGAALAESREGVLTILHVIENRHHHRLRAAMSERFHELVDSIHYRRVEIRERSSDSAATTILEYSQAYQTTVLGAFAEQRNSPVLVQAAFARMVRQLRGTVILARRA
ncbi:MAG: hypothetical protein ACR2MZ_09450 [Candidatus Dormibacter sp.]|uniref:universal stress protein n=1 Tax=Candidatus Dormibacter sp. TaxID=2973982 RepID=UPI000DB57F92|nr:MAG: hypothetical protein DLM66_03090 [Candidatus Dormibacteraeota bacterium]